MEEKETNQITIFVLRLYIDFCVYCKLIGTSGKKKQRNFEERADLNH